MLSGYKTYIVVFVAMIVNGAWMMGYIDETTIKMIDSFLVFLGLGTLRAGMKKKSQ